jgi:hypothetical protein
MRRAAPGRAGDRQAGVRRSRVAWWRWCRGRASQRWRRWSVLGRRCQGRVGNGGGGVTPGRGHQRSEVALGGVALTQMEVEAMADNGVRWRWWSRTAWQRRKLSEMKSWARGDCWACGEKLGLWYKTTC